MTKMKILSVRNPQWANRDRTAINCRIKTNTHVEEMPFTASMTDSEDYGREIFARCLAGEFGEIAPMEEPSPLPPPPQPTTLPSNFQVLERFLLEANLENGRKSFRSVAIVWGAMLDNLLDKMLEVEARRTSAAGNSVAKPPKRFNDRINRALKEGLIDQGEADRCQHIRRIRNAAAHEWELSLATKDVLPSLRALHEADHAGILVFCEDLDFLLQQVYSSSCGMLVMRFLERLPTGDQ